LAIPLMNRRLALGRLMNRRLALRRWIVEVG
jgi:hypothetical protein